MMNTKNLAIALLPFFLSAFGLVGCGSDDPAPVQSNQANQEQEETNQDNGQEENQNDGQQNQDRYGIEDVPAHMIVSVSPVQWAYPVGTRITPTAAIYNYNWETLSGVDFEWSVTPEAAVEKDEDNDRWFVREEGDITFRACVTDPRVYAEVCAERVITVSDQAPEITLESPLPGDHFDGADFAMIPVEGVVSTSRDVDHVVINGEVVPLDEDSRFSHEITPVFGINTVFVRAFDGLHPDDGVAAASFIWAPQYLPTSEDTDNGGITTSLPSAIIMKLGQFFFDDFEPPTVISESHILTQDLADIIHLVLQYLDMGSQIPDPVIDSSGFVLSVPEVRVSSPRVEIDTTDEGLHLYAQIPELIAETAGHIELSDQTLDLSGEISARLSIFAAIDARKTASADSFHVELQHFELAIEDATPNFNSDEANAIFALAESALRENLEDIILDSVNLSFIDTLPELLEDVFSSLEEAIAYQEFELDAGMGDPVVLEFTGKIGELLPTHLEGLSGYVTADLFASGSSHYPESPGVAVNTEEPREFPFFDASRVEIGLDLALINSFFHLLWDVGMLDIDITEMIPGSFSALIQDGQAEGKLPPVAAPPIGDEPYDLMIHLGQLELELGWTDRTDRFGARLAVGADLNIADDSIAIEIGEDPIIDLWLIDTTSDAPLLDADDLELVIRTQLWPRIEESIGEGLSFGLPVPEISGLDEFAPALEDLLLDIRMTRPLATRTGFLMLDLAFEGELLLP